MSLYRHSLFWIFILATTFFFLWLLSGVMLPFVTGMVVAYLLHPLVTCVVARGYSRTFVTGALLVSILLLMGVVLALALPMILSQLRDFVLMIPNILDRAQAVASERVPTLAPMIQSLHLNDLPVFFKAHLEQITSLSGGVAQGVVSGGKAALSVLTFIAIMPIVALYMTLEWPRILTWVDDLLPRAHAATLHDLACQIDERISGFVRGQIIVCGLLGIFYAVGLTLVGLQYGAVIGLVTGVLSIIPFVGSIFGLVASITVALFQVPLDGWGVLIGALVVFAVGQFTEGNIVTPRIVGDRVGLHPLWIIFALMVGGSAMGILGMLISVPVAATIAVLLGFFMAQYKTSVYYTGTPAKSGTGAGAQKS